RRPARFEDPPLRLAFRVWRKLPDCAITRISPSFEPRLRRHGAMTRRLAMNEIRKLWWCLVWLAALAVPASAWDVPFVPTPPEVVRGMLELAEVGPDDVVYDLGSGDGRIVIMAAKTFGARGVGIERDPALVERARARARAAGVADRVRFVQGDMFEADLRSAAVV